ncbi:hypothetical protein LWC35_06230 [Pseudonocardia kujensis]|uniref:hypothetical protein n=1 Tax=Pseudonocardia kujensis TaxID=1128675 RepID=UPI001E2E2A01|nr:hypothetical protein [Pseudonocardia kujensis]MCE0762509.1 hypothetical protein [Pseudonocardia kujensis]
MTLNPHLATPVVRRGPAPTQATQAALLVHGRGQDPTFMVGVADRIGLADVHCVLPAAAGEGWYPGRFMDPPEANEPGSATPWRPLTPGCTSSRQRASVPI